MKFFTDGAISGLHLAMWVKSLSASSYRLLSGGFAKCGRLSSNGMRHSTSFTALRQDIAYTHGQVSVVKQQQQQQQINKQKLSFMTKMKKNAVIDQAQLCYGNVDGHSPLSSLHEHRALIYNIELSVNRVQLHSADSKRRLSVALLNSPKT